MREPPIILSNQTTLSVGELSRAIKSSLENQFGRLQIRGEIVGLATPPSGHLYFSLSDAIDDSRLQAVCFRGSAARLNHQPQNGDEVIVEAKLTAYSARSQYQLVISQISLAGVGALLKMLETRRQKLTAEGLFDTAHKKPLPLLPRKIGVITSEKGAVWQDILHRLEDRCPMPVLLWPTLVQGEGASEQICAAIAGMNQLPTAQRPDVLIVARGGGSMEDLMAFQQENVVRSVAASDIPIVSAIGHETDTTLIDYAADLRAPTPTAAAEMVVPMRSTLLNTIAQYRTRLHQRLEREINHWRLRLRHHQQFLTRSENILAPAIQRHDMAAMHLAQAISKKQQQHQHQLQLSRQRLRSPTQILQHQRQRLELQNAQMRRIILQQWQHSQQRYTHLCQLLRHSSHQATLERGFALVEDSKGVVIQRAEQLLLTGQSLTLRFADGTIQATTVAQKNRCKKE